MGKLNIKTLLQSGLADTRIDDIYKAAQQQQLLQSKLADPKNLADAAQTAQEIQNPAPEQQ